MRKLLRLLPSLPPPSPYSFLHYQNPIVHQTRSTVFSQSLPNPPKLRNSYPSLRRPQLPLAVAAAHLQSMRKLLRLLSSLSPPSPYSFLHYRNSSVPHNGLYSCVPAPKIVFDLVTLLVIAGFLLLSLVAFAFIFNLHLRSRRARYLQNFSSFWPVRSLLVSLASLWAVNEILRLPFVRGKHSYPFLPSIPLEKQASICKLHVVLSLGFLEPGFLITVFQLVNVSIQKRNSRRVWSIISVLALCCPIIFLQIMFVYFSPVEAQLTRFRHTSSVLSTDQYGNKTMLCIYPVFSCVIFGIFALAYSVAFLMSCWRVMRLVINKRIGNRINLLAITVTVALTAQILCFSLSWWWMPEDVAYGGVVLGMFLSVVWCMAAGEVLLVLKPIRDSLAAGGECCQWRPTAGGREETGAWSAIL